MKWSSFEPHIMDLDKDLRRKTYLALRKVVRKLPAYTFAGVPELRIYAPSGVYGSTFSGDRFIFVYLDSCLELEPMAEAVFTIAHELAHAVLQHPFSCLSREKREEAADQLAADWGFKEPVNTCNLCGRRLEDTNAPESHRGDV